MKKSIYGVICIILCMSLGGCGSHKSKNDTSGKTENFYSNPIVLTKLQTEGSESLLKTEGRLKKEVETLDVITSWKEWEDFSESLTDEQRSKCSYDKDFFEDRDLLLIKFVGKNEDRYSLERMELTTERLLVDMDEKIRICPGYDTEDLLSLHKMGLLVEVDKDSVPKDVSMRIIMEEGFYIERLGYVKDIQKQAEGKMLEFDEAEYVRDGVQPEQLQLISKGEAVKTYNIGENVQYVVRAAGIEQYNQQHDKKLKGRAFDQENIELEETVFMEYLEYLNQSDVEESIVCWITIDDEQIVMVREKEV